MIVGRRALLAFGATLAASRRALGAPPAPTLPLAIAVAEEAGDGGVAQVAPDAWIDAQVAEADRLFALHGVRFRSAYRTSLPAAHAHMRTRGDRDALAPLVRAGAINVFVVASLADVDEPGRLRMGVCWSARGDASMRYVILSAIAKPTVLAHELGHYHGLAHSHVVDNVMSYDRTEGGQPFFDEAQAKTIRASARAFVERGQLRL